MSYNACVRKTIEPNFAPNYWLYLDQIFSVHGAVQKAFPMSPAIGTSPFFTDITNINFIDMSLIVD